MAKSLAKGRKMPCPDENLEYGNQKYYMRKAEIINYGT